MSRPPQPPRTPTTTPLQPSGRPPLPVGTRRRVINKSASFASDKRFHAPPLHEHQPINDDRRPESRRFAIQRSVSHDVMGIDTSHIYGLKEVQRQLEEEREAAEAAELTEASPSRIGTPEIGNDFPEKPVRDSGYTAEEIALRRFMTVVAWGAGMPVLKHNRGRGRVRRVLKFNDEDGYLMWSGLLPPYPKTKVSAEMLRTATRTGHLVTLKIQNEGDVGFQCNRLTDAIVLEVGLNGVIRACNVE